MKRNVLHTFRYSFVEEAEIDLLAVRRERIKLKDELKTLETEMEGFLRELGYE